jgi:acetyl esterase/lipase
MRVPRWLKIVAMALVVVGVVGAFLVWRAVKPPTVSSFYRAPSVTGRPPGEVLRSESIPSRAAGARLWRILYTSTDARGRVVPVSALIAAPTRPASAGGYPLVAVAHGTIGIAQGCAPSIAPFAKADGEATSYDFLVGQYVKAGYATVMADFEGLGVGGANSYLVGASEGHNVLDAARAARHFGPLALAPGTLIAGQSQGGHAALWAGQLAPSYAPEVAVTGVVAQAPATDLESLFEGIARRNKRGGVVSLPIMAIDAYTRTYRVLVDDVLTRRGRASLENVVGKVCLFPALLATQLARPSDLIQPDGLARLRPYVRQNEPGTTFEVPVFLAQGRADEVVDPAVTDAFAGRLCAAGVNVHAVDYPDVGHFDVVAASTPDVLAWMRQVRAGTPPLSTCATR